MSALYSPRLQDEKTESLQTQYEFLNLVRLRHLQWANDTDDPQIKHLHLEIAELIENITDQYSRLLHTLQ
jgi:hypothetical protein